MVSGFLFGVMLLIVYVDVLLFINALVNYFMLLGVKVISKAETKRIRIGLGAILGGASSITVLYNLGYLATAIKILTGALMILVSFPFISLKSFFKKCLWLFLISFIFGGICFGVYTLFDTDLMIYSSGTVYFDIDITFLTVCTVISFVAISLISRLTDKKIPKKEFYDITIILGDNKQTLKGFMDTGNNLKEPFSFAPVIVTNEKIYKIFCDDTFKRRERIIPVSTANGDGIIHAIRLDGAIFLGREIHNIYLGCSKNIPEGYDVLLCPDLLSEDNYEKTKITL